MSDRGAGARWAHHLERWIGEGLIDAATAERIRAFEARHQEAAGLRWPVLVAIALGGLLLGAGVLLFVAAHWDALSPSGRFTLVLALVTLFHVAAAFVAERLRPSQVRSMRSAPCAWGPEYSSPARSSTCRSIGLEG